MLRTILSLSLLLATQMALAAIPPMSNEAREIYASHIVEGKVAKVEKVLVDVRGENEQFKDWHCTAHVEVSKFIKGEPAAEMAAEAITVKYWKPAKRPRGWTGSQGQNGSMTEGDAVKLFMNKDADSESYHLLMPNGWELLNDTQSNLMDMPDEDMNQDDDMAAESES